MSEKRKFTRVPFHVEAKVKGNKGFFSGALVDLSVRGMCVLVNADVDLNESVDVELRLETITPNILVQAKGVVKRKENDKLAIEIKEMDIESFSHLKKIIDYNSGLPEKIADEFCEFIKNS